ncbi:MAG: hypothetical protein IJ430_09485 [Parabacteroides sp.]|nr:hypothetical protein [Parabacteroides sp.]
MRKEFGKWLMDVAKYMTTAILISSVFNDVEGLKMKFICSMLSAFTLVTGLYLVRDIDKKFNKRNRRT